MIFDVLMFMLLASKKMESSTKFRKIVFFLFFLILVSWQPNRTKCVVFTVTYINTTHLVKLLDFVMGTFFCCMSLCCFLAMICYSWIDCFF